MSQIDSQEGRAEQRMAYLRFVDNVRRLRTLGCALSAIAIGVVLYQRDAAAGWWVLFFFNALIWPHFARWLAHRSDAPDQTELRSLLVDSAMGGVWIAAMHFALLPSVLLATMLTMDKIAVSGSRFAIKATLALISSALLTSAALGFAFEPHTNMLQIAACLPFLVAYPLAISFTVHGLALRVKQQNQQLRAMTRVDGATGLLNRSHWESLVENELLRSRRSGRPAALLMIDIDDFKRINDQFGHAVGDDVIRRIVSVIQDTVREIDMAGRYGGDEFGVLLPETRLDDASLVAERLRRRIETTLAAAPAAVPCTVSVGVAAASPALRGARDWIIEADAGMYLAKRQGRNQVGRTDGAPQEAVPTRPHLARAQPRPGQVA